MNQIFKNLEEELQKELINRVPIKDKELIDEDIYYETFIQYLISRSCLEEKYDRIAYNLSIEQHERKTEECFIKTVENIQKNQDITGKTMPLLQLEFYQFIIKEQDNIKKLFKEIREKNEPFEMTYFGWKTVYRSYLIRTDKGVMERLDHLWFRVALFLYRDDYEKVTKTFQILRNGNAIHATPTLFNAGLKNPQMASCFLLGTEDSVKGIFKTIGDAATISKFAGGLGIHISNIRGKKSYIYGTNGYSNGIMPMMRVYNDTSRYIDQCFESSTLVVTHRGMIKISDIKPQEDYILTKNGNFHRVKKKLMHIVDENMIALEIITPWKEKVQHILTNKHDLYWNNSVTKENDFFSVEKAYLGCTPVFIQPNSVDIPYSIQDCWILGYIYSNMKYEGEMILRSVLPIEDFYVEMIISFFKSNYANCYQVRDAIIELNLSLWKSNVPSVIDLDLLHNKDIPMEFVLTTIPKMKSFWEGYIYQKNGKIEECIGTCYPKLHMIQYRIGCMFGKSKIQSIQQIENTARIMYDLEIDTEHNYQTSLGLAHNGGGKRKGAFAMYIEPWHNDIYDFIQARRNTGNEEERTRDLFLALWIPDEFMRRVESNDDWYLMSENQSPFLSQVWGEEFDNLYRTYIDEKKYIKKIKARDLWFEILKSQIETGTPYILYKDNCNRCSNQQNLGTIKSSNLCCEIIEYSDEKEYAVCNLASISLPSCLKSKILPKDLSFWIFGKENCFYCTILKSFLDKNKIDYIYIDNINLLNKNELQRIRGFDKYPIVFLNDLYVGGFMDVWKKYLRPEFDFDKLGDITMHLVENLNKIIDLNAYPLEECKYSNLKNRPIGLGVQGLHDVFMSLLEPYDSTFSRQLNQQIFETIYFFALKKSHELALIHGPYNSFIGSPLSKGIFHFQYFDHWHHYISSSRFDWNDLRQKIIHSGIRNSLLIAPMPTASTSQILGNTESFEPLTSNFYLRRTLAGEFYVINKYLRYFLRYGGQWLDDNIQRLILDKGSVLHMDIPSEIKNVFRTVWEMPQKNLIEMAADRQMFIDQSQSFNIYLSKPDMNILTKIHFYGWKKKLKTGCYYLRTRSIISSQNFNIDPDKDETCISCSA